MFPSFSILLHEFLSPYIPSKMHESTYAGPVSYFALEQDLKVENLIKDVLGTDPAVCVDPDGIGKKHE